MTTIAADRGMLAGDQKCTDDDKSFRTRKIRKVGEALVGAAGTGPAIGKFFRWLESGKQEEPPKFAKDDELAALVVTPDGLFVYDTSCTPEEILDDFYAVGSGAQAALAAMHLGCQPDQAVAIACKVDNNTGGQVDLLYLNGYVRKEPAKARKTARA